MVVKDPDLQIFHHLFSCEDSILEPTINTTVGPVLTLNSNTTVGKQQHEIKFYKLSNLKQLYKFLQLKSNCSTDHVNVTGRKHQKTNVIMNTVPQTYHHVTVQLYMSTVLSLTLIQWNQSYLPNLVSYT